MRRCSLSSYSKSQAVEDVSTAESGKTSEQAKDDQLIKQQINKLMDVTLKLTKSFEGLDVSQDEGGELCSFENNYYNYNNNYNCDNYCNDDDNSHNNKQ